MLTKVTSFFSMSVIIFFTTLGFKCGSDNDEINMYVNSNLQAARFDIALTSNKNQPIEARYRALQNEYGNFLNRFINDIIHIRTEDNAQVLSELNRFLNDPDFKEVNNAVKDTFSNVSDIEKTIGPALGRYKYYFPEKSIPRVITFVSLFNYAIICTDTVLGIGLDMYLGSQSKYYPALGFPQYKIRKMQREYIPPDAMRGWVESEFEPVGNKQDFLTYMIHQGKILYLLNALMSEESDTLLTGYSASQLQWCYDNEEKIWAFFIERQLLFSSNMELFSKYLSEGPTTNGFPPESPGSIGSFVGWQIVKAYMKENSDVTPAMLMKQADATLILKDSKYKPKK